MGVKMNYSVRFLKPSELYLYPEIPEYFSLLNDHFCEIIGFIFENELAGLLVTTTNKDASIAARLQYMYFADGKKSIRLMHYMLSILCDELKKKGISELEYFYCLLGNIPEEALKPADFNKLGFKKESAAIHGCGWYVQDVFDTDFFINMMPFATSNECLKGFSNFSENRNLINLRKLGEGAKKALIESPYGKFYISDNDVLGMLTMEVKDDKTIIVPDFFVKENTDSYKVFEELLAGVLDLGLEGQGMDARVFGRFSDETQLEKMENIFGKSTIPVSFERYSLIL